MKKPSTTRYQQLIARFEPRIIEAWESQHQGYLKGEPLIAVVSKHAQTAERIRKKNGYESISFFCFIVLTGIAGAIMQRYAFRHPIDQQIIGAFAGAILGTGCGLIYAIIPRIKLRDELAGYEHTLERFVCDTRDIIRGQPDGSGGISLLDLLKQLEQYARHVLIDRRRFKDVRVRLDRPVHEVVADGLRLINSEKAFESLWTRLTKDFDATLIEGIAPSKSRIFDLARSSLPRVEE